LAFRFYKFNFGKKPQTDPAGGAYDDPPGLIVGWPHSLRRLPITQHSMPLASRLDALGTEKRTLEVPT